MNFSLLWWLKNVSLYSFSKPYSDITWHTLWEVLGCKSNKQTKPPRTGRGYVQSLSSRSSWSRGDGCSRSMNEVSSSHKLHLTLVWKDKKELLDVVCREVRGFTGMD
jgi:hypothetical protein